MCILLPILWRVAEVVRALRTFIRNSVNPPQLIIFTGELLILPALSDWITQLWTHSIYEFSLRSVRPNPISYIHDGYLLALLARLISPDQLKLTIMKVHGCLRQNFPVKPLWLHKLTSELNIIIMWCFTKFNTNGQKTQWRPIIGMMHRTQTQAKSIRACTVSHWAHLAVHFYTSIDKDW